MKVDEIDVSTQIGKVGEILELQEKKKGVLIHALQKMQEDLGYLPEEALRRLAEKLGIPLSEIYSVATFYRMFHFRPRGKKVVKVCLGTACYVRGSNKVLAALEQKFRVRSGETTEDLAMTLETVGCVGCCGLAPVAAINETVTGEIMGEKKIEAFIRNIREDEKQE